MTENAKVDQLDLSCGEVGQVISESSAGDAGVRGINRVMTGAKINVAGEAGRFSGIDYQGPQVIHREK